MKEKISSYTTAQQKPKGLTLAQRLHYLNKNKSMLFMLLPGVLCLIAFNYMPMAGVLIAFKNINYVKGFIKSDWIGFKNFEFLFRTPDAYVITRNTVLYNVAFIILGIAIAVFFAVALSELKNKFFSKTYQTVMFLPYFLSWVSVSYLVYALLKVDLGFVNRTILVPLGMKPIEWYTEPKYWPFIIIALHIWKVVGYNSVVYLAAITGIDPEYYEAAAIDGATKWQQIIHITIPSISTVMIILLILDVGRIFHADFGLFYHTTLNSGALYPVTNVIDTYVFKSLRITGDLGMAAAASLYQAVVGLVLVLATNAVVNKIDSEKSLL